MASPSHNHLLRNPSLLDNINVFLPLPKAKGPRPKREVIHKLKRGTDFHVRICMYESLDIFDEDVLFSLLYLCKPKYNAIMPRPDDANLIAELKLNMPQQHPPLILTTTIPDIIKTMKKTNSGQRKAKVRASLSRLAKTSITFNTEKFEGSTNFLSFSVEKSTDELTVVINPISVGLLTQVLKGYNTHDLKERFSLKDGMPRKIHKVFNSCTFVDKGTGKRKGTLYLSNLVSMVKGCEVVKSDDIKQIRKHLTKMKSKLTWRITIIGRGKSAIVKWVQ